MPFGVLWIIVVVFIFECVTGNDLQARNATSTGNTQNSQSNTWECFSYPSTKGNCWMKRDKNCTSVSGCHPDDMYEYQPCESSICKDLYNVWQSGICDSYNGTCHDLKGCTSSDLKEYICNMTIAGGMCPSLCDCCDSNAPPPPQSFHYFLHPTTTTSTTTTTAPPTTTLAKCRTYNGICQDNSACQLPEIRSYICDDMQAGEFCPKYCGCC